MKGHILDFSVQSNTGVISGADGSRYMFSGPEWKGALPPARGELVDFEVNGTTAVSVYKAVGVPSSNAGGGSKSKIAAGLFALFLGGLGIHKFYLGFTTPAVIFLVGFLVGLVVLCSIPSIIFCIIALIEGIIYLTKTDEEFERIYVVGKREWF